MASLREIKDRIGSVRSTLKITSAMKLVASAKLRKAQKAIEALRPYEQTLAEILATVGSAAITPRPLRILAPLSAEASQPKARRSGSCAAPVPGDGKQDGRRLDAPRVKARRLSWRLRRIRRCAAGSMRT